MSYRPAARTRANLIFVVVLVQRKLSTDGAVPPWPGFAELLNEDWNAADMNGRECSSTLSEASSEGSDALVVPSAGVNLMVYRIWRIVWQLREGNVGD